MSPPHVRPRLGHVLLAVGLCGIGALDLRYADFALNWQPVPAGLPLRPYLACGSGALLILCAAGTFIRPISGTALSALAWVTLSWLALMEAPRVAVHPLNEGDWLGFCETLMLTAGTWLLRIRREGRGGRALRAGQIAFGASLPLIGLSHFMYARSAVGLVPTWLPMRLGLVYLTGAAHVAAGAAVLLGVIPLVAATAEAAMLTCFVLLIHLPGIVHDPTGRLPWTMLCIATAYVGAAWLAAGSFRKTSP
ncbi:MAG: DoxX family membrane protein [Opitutaceae bacterium]